MTQTRRRITLYGVAIVLAAGLLVAGFGITLPPDPWTRLSGAQMVGNLGDYAQAVDICDQVLAEHPDNLDARIFRATFLARAGRYEEALAAYGDAREHAESTETRRNIAADRASVLLEMGRTEEFERAREELAAERLDAHVHLLDGLAARRRNDRSASAHAFRRALEADPENAVARSYLASTLLEEGKEAVAAGRFDTARVAFDEARELFPDAEEPLRLGAEVRLAADDPGGAARLVAAAPSHVHGRAPLLFRAATALLEKEAVNEALAALAAAGQADREATRTLLQRERAWDAHRNTGVVQALHSETPPAPEGALPGKE